MNQHKKTLEDMLKKLPPGYQVSEMVVNGTTVPMDLFSNYDNGLVYYVVDGKVAVYDAKKVHGLLFAAPEDEVDDGDDDFGEE